MNSELLELSKETLPSVELDEKLIRLVLAISVVAKTSHLLQMIPTITDINICKMNDGEAKVEIVISLPLNI